MATTIQQQPPEDQPVSVYGPVVVRLSAPSTSGIYFRYVLEVDDGLGNLLARLKVPPNAADEGLFDIQRILRDYLHAPLEVGGAPLPLMQDLAAFPDAARDNTPARLFRLNMGSQVAVDAESAPVVTIDHVSKLVNAINFRGDGADTRWNRLVELKQRTVEAYPPNNGGVGWLSDMTETTYDPHLGSSGPAFFQQCLVDDYRGHTIMYAGNTGNRDMNVGVTALHLAFYNDSSGTWTTEVYTLATLLGTASGSVTQDSEMVAAIATGPQNWIDEGTSAMAALLQSGAVTRYELRLYSGSAPVSFPLVTDIVNKDCYNGAPITLGWVNRAGGWDYFNFTKKRVRMTTPKAETFERDAGTWQQATDFEPFTDMKGGTTAFKMTDRRSIEMTSDWLDDAQAALLESLFVSEAVFLRSPDINTAWPKVYVSKGQYTLKTQRNERLKRYTVTVEYAKTRRTA